MKAPMDVPPTMSTGMPHSVRARMMPTWAQPLHQPGAHSRGKAPSPGTGTCHALAKAPEMVLPSHPLLLSACLLHNHRKRAKTQPRGHYWDTKLKRLCTDSGGWETHRAPPEGGSDKCPKGNTAGGWGGDMDEPPQGQESQRVAEAIALSLTPLFLFLIYDPPKSPVPGNRPHDHGQEETSNRGGPRGSPATQTGHRLQTTVPSKSQGPKGLAACMPDGSTSMQSATYTCQGRGLARKGREF